VGRSEDSASLAIPISDLRLSGRFQSGIASMVAVLEPKTSLPRSLIRNQSGIVHSRGVVIDIAI
jgi:hypothetical protein